MNSVSKGETAAEISRQLWPTCISSFKVGGNSPENGTFQNVVSYIAS